MLRARWEAGNQRVVIETATRLGWLAIDSMSGEEWDEFCDQAEAVRNEAHGVAHVEPWPDERVELPATAVLDDPEADLPTVVRLSDGSARVDLEFGDDVRLDRRLGELGRE
jgi:hypothetical protein